MTTQLPKGYMGQILSVDLSTNTTHQEALDPALAERYFGGRGLGIALLFQHFHALQQQGRCGNPFTELDPLSPDNALILSTSPTTGTKMPTAGRFHLSFKSPLTGALGSSNSGGFWGVLLKRTGRDVLAIHGKAALPTYLIISRKGVEFRSAEHLTPLNAEESTEEVLKDLPKGTQVLAIGPSGRQGGRFAAVINEKGRAFGRGGSGAVFGSKNLYAIAVIPERDLPVEVADAESLSLKQKGGAAFKAKIKLEVGKLSRKEEHYGFLSSMGSLGLAGMVYNYGQLVHNNMRDTVHRDEDMHKITGEALRTHAQQAQPGERKIEVKKGTCFNCPIACKRKTRVLDEDGELMDAGEGPEFETVALLGANLSLYDLPLIAQANYQANRYGLDTISLGGAIAALFELYEYVQAKTTDLSEPEQQFQEDVAPFVEAHGEPRFGNTAVLLPLIEQIGTLTGIGYWLAQGSRRFCEHYGHPEFAMQVKGLDLPAYDPRTSFSQALCYEMNNRGGGHLQGGYTAVQDYCAGYGEWPGDRIEGTPLISKNASLKNTVIDIIGACVYGSFSLTLDEYAHLINAVTGLDYNAGLLQRIAWRVLTLERLFNTCCGLTDADDWLPLRFFEDPITVNGRKVVCQREAHAQMHREYYQAMGWDAQGRPTAETLRALEIDYPPCL